MLLVTSNQFAQLNPTLGVGLETLTFNKGTIDVEVLTKVIMKKQKELKNEALKRFMLKMFPNTDYTTRFYVQNSLNILLNEKNPQVIEKEILELTTNYAISLGVTKAIEKLDNTIFIPEHHNKNIHFDYEKILNNIDFKDEVEKYKKIETAINKDKRSLNDMLLHNNDPKYLIKTIKGNEKRLNQIERKLLKNNIDIGKALNKPIQINLLTFGEKLDLVSLALSQDEFLKKKGFFKNKIDYTEESSFIFSEDVDKSIISNINDKIKPYIQNYEIIKNFLKNTNIENSNNIAKDLESFYMSQMNMGSEFSKIINNDELFTLSKSEIDKLNYYNSILNEITKFNEYKNLQIDALETSKLNLIEKTEIAENLNVKVESLRNSISILNSVNKKFNLDKNLVFENSKNKKNTNSIFNPPINDNDKKIIESIKNLSLSSDEKQKISSKIDSITNNYTINPNFIKEIRDFKSTIKTIEFVKFTKGIDSLVTLSKNSIFKNPTFLTQFLKNLTDKIEKGESYSTTVNTDAESKNKTAILISKIYQKLQLFKNENNYSISDITSLENELLNELVGLKYIDPNSNTAFYNELIKGIHNLTPLLKVKLINDKKLTIKYDNELLSLFEFIGNLDKLDKAKTYGSIIDLIKENSLTIAENLPNGKFKDAYNLFINGVKKYTLINPKAEKEYVEIDVVSFLNDLQQYYNRNNPSKFSLYLTIGLNQNMFIDKFNFPDNSEQISAIGFASEKIGVKYKILDFQKFKGYENAIKSDVYLNKRAPFINEWFISVYGSGLLYSLANTTTNKNFNFSHVGISTGFRFYNALDFNIMLGLPFVKNQPFGNNGFIGIGFDVPLGEYLEALGNK